MKRIVIALSLAAFNYGIAFAFSTDLVPPEDNSVMRLADGSIDCAAYDNYIGAEPKAVAAACDAPVASAKLMASASAPPASIGYAQDVGYISDNFVSFPLDDFPGQTVIGTNTSVFYGMDFDPSGTILYALNDTTDQLGTINLETGEFTSLVPCIPPNVNWTGLTIDPSTGTFYASDTTTLYTIDPSTGAPTVIGAFGTALMIDIAMNTEGELYGHDIGADSIYQIDPATGAATLIGPTGFAANYAQGMDFNDADGTLYIFLYIGSGANVYGTVNLDTGAVTQLAANSPLGEFEGAIPNTSETLTRFPWPMFIPKKFNNAQP